MRFTNFLIQAAGVLLVACLLPIIVAMGVFAFVVFTAMSLFLGLVGGIIYLIMLVMLLIARIVWWFKRTFRRKKS